MVQLAPSIPHGDGDVPARSPSTSSRRTSPDDEALAAVEKYDDRFLDRELSWLRFNQRVLELAEDPTLPLLERVRFLAIFASNLDEFFMVRVAGLKRRIAAGLAVRAASGLMPREVLEPIWPSTRELMRAARPALPRGAACPALAEAGIELVRWDDLDREEQKICKRLFQDRIFPVLTPLAVDPAHPFPYISGLSLNLAVLVRNPKTGKEHFARVKVPPIFRRFVPARATSASSRSRTSSASTSSGCSRAWRSSRSTPSGSPATRTSRSRRTTPRTSSPALEKELLRRRFGPPVRLEVEESIAPQVLELLVSELGVTERGGVPRSPGRSTCAGCTASPTCRARS